MASIPPVQPIQVVKVGSSSVGKGLFGLRTFLFYSFLFVIIVVIFASATIQSIQEHSMKPFLDAVVNRLLLASNDLNNASLNIINNGGTFTPEGWFGNNIWEFLSSVFPLIVSIYVILMWIKLFAFLVKKSPWSNESNWFINYSGGIIIYLVLEMFGILIYNSVNHNINSIVDALKSLAIPFTAFGNFFSALSYIFKPLSDLAGKYYKNMSSQNITILNNSMSLI